MGGIADVYRQIGDSGRITGKPEVMQTADAVGFDDDAVGTRLAQNSFAAEIVNQGPPLARR